MLAIGDRVEILAQRGEVSRYGDVVHIDTGVKAAAQPGLANPPNKQPSYSVKLNSGEVVHHLIERQLRKL